jgi:hypothetical protein
MPVPDFSPGEVLTAAAMDSIGLWKIASGPLSGAATNFQGCFTSSFRNYRIEISEVQQTVGWCGFRWLQGSTPIATNYFYALYGRTSGGAAVGDQGAAQTFGALGYAFQSTSGGSMSCSYDIFNPQIAARSLTNGGYSSLNAGGGTYNFYSGGATHDSAGIFDGIQILTTGSGSQTGNVRIYGYRD